jgi:LysR family transcriptional regulator, hydrogen peroxide-inducible genes activator
LELLQLRYFVSVAKAGSFVKAAEHENVSQPALSQQIAKLEIELGTPLFDRLGRALRLTALGRQLLPRAESVLNETTLIRRDAEASRNNAAGRVTVGVIPTLLPYVVAPLLARLAVDLPEIELILVEEQTTILLDKLRSADIDLAILALPVRNPEIVCSELKREELVFIVPMGRNLPPGPVDLQSVTQERLLLLREGNCLRDDVLTACSRARAQFSQVFETDQLASIFALVSAGAGASLVPESSLTMHQGSGGVQAVPLRQRVYRRIGYALSRKHQPTPTQKTFIRWLRQSVAATGK